MTTALTGSAAPAAVSAIVVTSPELITLDPWGYPIVAPGPVPPAVAAHARRAVAACPALALLRQHEDDATS
ncbi:MAG TPA: hypothetical protein VF204_09955 [Streptosporangiaceae bacterium]